jgi:hypothetical protein
MRCRAYQGWMYAGWRLEPDLSHSCPMGHDNRTLSMSMHEKWKDVPISLTHHVQIRDGCCNLVDLETLQKLEGRGRGLLQ